jgi:hypothetical protein
MAGYARADPGTTQTIGESPQPKGARMAFASLNDVFKGQIEDLYSAESQLVGALPRLAV